jgi:hypothetical protein
MCNFCTLNAGKSTQVRPAMNLEIFFGLEVSSLAIFSAADTLSTSLVAAETTVGGALILGGCLSNTSCEIALGVQLSSCEAGADRGEVRGWLSIIDDCTG